MFSVISGDRYIVTMYLLSLGGGVSSHSDSPALTLKPISEKNCPFMPEIRDEVDVAGSGAEKTVVVKRVRKRNVKIDFMMWPPR